MRPPTPEKLAAANLAVAAQKDIEQQRIAAQLAMAAMGAPGANGGAPKNISEMGALLNTSEAADRQSPLPSGESRSSGGGAASGGGTAPARAGDSADTPGADFMSGSSQARDAGSALSGSRRDLALGRALFVNLGVPAGDLVLADKKVTPATPAASLEVTLFADFPSP